MKHLEADFVGFDETTIYYQSWSPEVEIRAILIIVHGFGEHSGRYTNVVNALSDQGIAIYALDHRGHGRSGGRHNYVNRFSDYLTDLSTFEALVVEQYPDTPMFMLGHSMGSLIATHFMSQNPKQTKYTSLILSGTGADFGPGVNKVTLVLAKVLSVLAPKLSIPSNLDPDFISRDESAVEAYINDPLVHYEKITARLGGEMLKHTGLMIEAASKINIPTLIQIGSEDEAFAAESRQPLLEAINHTTKELKVYQGYRHEVYNELDNEVVLNDLKAWVNKLL